MYCRDTQSLEALDKLLDEIANRVTFVPSELEHLLGRAYTALLSLRDYIPQINEDDDNE